MVWLSYPHAAPLLLRTSREQERCNWDAMHIGVVSRIAQGATSRRDENFSGTSSSDTRARLQFQPRAAINRRMKTLSLLLSLFAATALSLHAQISPIRMTVEQVSKSEVKGKTGAEKTQVRSLNINLVNNSNESFDGLEVKYWFFGRDMKSREVKVINAGERKSSLTPRAKELVESESVSSSYVEEHYEVAKGKGGKGGKPTKVPASGAKIMGYAVRVMKDGKVLAEYYSEPSYKERVNAATN
jgi:hypothetical protein